VFLHHGVNPVQAIAGETSLFRSGSRQTRAERQGCDQTENEEYPHERKSTKEAGSASGENQAPAGWERWSATELMPSSSTGWAAVRKMSWIKGWLE